MNLQLKHLFDKLQSTQNRIEVASILVDLAEQAEGNPTLQDALRKTELPVPFDCVEYIKKSNCRGYWARKPYWREHPTTNQLQARLDFSEINYSLFGTRGTAKRPDGTRIGRVNYLAGDIMRGRKTVSDKEKAELQKQKTIERISGAHS